MTKENEQHSILVVEDELPLQKAIKNKLETSGFQVLTSRTVEQAIGYLEDDVKIDVIWLDHYLLGKENGLDLVTQLKSDGTKWKKIPVFVVSNTATPQKVQSYLRLGINKYFAKAEHRLDEIIKDIKIYLGGKKDE